MLKIGRRRFNGKSLGTDKNSGKTRSYLSISVMDGSQHLLTFTIPILRIDDRPITSIRSANRHTASRAAL